MDKNFVQGFNVKMPRKGSSCSLTSKLTKNVPNYYSVSRPKQISGEEQVESTQFKFNKYTEFPNKFMQPSFGIFCFFRFMYFKSADEILLVEAERVSTGQ